MGTKMSWGFAGSARVPLPFASASAAERVMMQVGEPYEVDDVAIDSSSGEDKTERYL